jgi:hypothetical protein
MSMTIRAAGNGYGLVHPEFIPGGHTVNKSMYVGVLCCLRDAVRKKCPEKWAQNSWFLLHDATCTSIIDGKKITCHALEHLPYTPDISLTVFLVSTTNNVLKG